MAGNFFPPMPPSLGSLVLNDNDDDYDDDGDGPTLRRVAERCCKRIDIGAAALPKPLLMPDWDEVEDEQNEEDEASASAAAVALAGGLLSLQVKDNVDDGGGGGGSAGAGAACRRDFRIPPPASAVSNKIEGATVASVPPEYDPSSPLSCCASSRRRRETRYARTLASEFNAVVVEHHLKWSPLCHSLPGPLPSESPTDRLGRYDFHSADLVVDWALRHGMKVKGHVLAWHVTTPPFVSDMDAAEVREQLRRHIMTTIGHFRGRIEMWDVVNESLAPDGTLADNVFLRKLGPGYIENCFRWAHKADPTAFLVYNDNKVEGMYGANAAKAEGYYRLLRDLKRRGAPVHGAGMQAHFNAGGTGRGRPPTPRSVKDQIRRIGDLGLKVNISEMDVRVSKLPPNLQQIAQRQIYRDIVAAALSEPSFDGIWLWGFTDRHTWVSHFYYDDQPLVFDEEYGRKDCYYGLREALETLTVGGQVGGGLGPYLESDYDDEGNAWGYLWQQPEPPTVEDDVNGEGGGTTKGDSGDSRPDWLRSE